MADDQVSLVKQANDIVDVISEYVPLRKVGRTFKGLCPFHADHNPSMTVDPTRQSWKCWPCQAGGDVYEFVMKKERIEFREALEMLARRAHIELRRGKPAGPGKNNMLEVMKWAEGEYHKHLLDSPAADGARSYLATRHLSDETIRTYGLGYAPNSWDWLVRRAEKAGKPADLLEKVGLIRPREAGNSFYDCFRDRVLFPIRDVRGRTVGFGGRILPSTSPSAGGPKYYNSSDTPLFAKSENLYGIDRARDAGAEVGFLAVVEGYTDVLMAHQLGVLPVVATLGTALNARHIAQLRTHVPRVILVYDADAGGETGVDRALELFLSQEVELKVATLPEGLDPCDLLVREGVEAFQAVLDHAVDALDFKLGQVLTPARMATLDGRLKAVEAVLRVLAVLPELPTKTTALKQEFAISRLALRAGVKEKTIWDRLEELRRAKKAPPTEGPTEPPEPVREIDPLEKQLLEVLLAEPALAQRTRQEVDPAEIRHPSAQIVLRQMYAFLDAGRMPDMDQLRMRFSDSPRLLDALSARQAAGLQVSDRAGWLEALLERFRDRRAAAQVQAARDQLKRSPSDEPPPEELLRQVQKRQAELDKRNRREQADSDRSG